MVAAPLLSSFCSPVTDVPDHSANAQVVLVGSLSLGKPTEKGRRESSVIITWALTLLYPPERDTIHVESFSDSDDCLCVGSQGSLCTANHLLFSIGWRRRGLLAPHSVRHATSRIEC